MTLKSRLIAHLSKNEAVTTRSKSENAQHVRLLSVEMKMPHTREGLLNCFCSSDFVSRKCTTICSFFTLWTQIAINVTHWAFKSSTTMLGSGQKMKHTINKTNKKKQQGLNWERLGWKPAADLYTQAKYRIIRFGLVYKSKSSPPPIGWSHFNLWFVFFLHSCKRGRARTLRDPTKDETF